MIENGAPPIIQLLHNDSAGNGCSKDRELVDLLEKEGFDGRLFGHSSRIAHQIRPFTDILAIAAGDGTVRKLVLDMLNGHLKHRRPIAILPHGTANNISRALGIVGTDKQIVQTWHKQHLHPFDIGQYRIGKKHGFFLESFGFGVISKLIRIFNDRKKAPARDAEEEINLARMCLLDIIKGYRAKMCHIKIGERAIKEKLLLLEVMNIPSIGPRLTLSANSDPGDRTFELVYVTESQRDILIDYVEQLIAGNSPKPQLDAIPLNNGLFKLPAKDWHADDHLLLRKSKGTVHIMLLGNMFEFVCTIKKNKK